MEINPNVKDIFNFKYEDFQLLDYNPHPHIKANGGIMAKIVVLGGWISW